IREHDAGQHRVGDGVAHERPADEHEPAAEQRADDARDERHGETTLDEAVGQALEEEIDHRTTPNARASTSGARPCPAGPLNTWERCSTTAWSARSGADPSSWVDTTTLVPRARSCLSTAVMPSCETESTPANGSSSSSTRASWAIARATNARLR